MKNEKLDNAGQNTGSANVTKSKNNSKATTVLIIILLIAMLAIGIAVGLMLSNKGNTVINKSQETVDKQDENESKNENNNENNNSDENNNNNNNNENNNDDENNNNTTDNKDIKEGEDDTNKTFNLSKDYIGYWSDRKQENNIKINSINGNKIKFDFGIFRTASLDNITATLISDNTATFTTDKEKDGMIIEGKLIFEEESVSLEVVKSDSDLIRVGYEQNCAYKNLATAPQKSDNNSTSVDSNVITSEDYIKLWETYPEDTEIQLYENGIFVTDHYTRASEIMGSYKVDNNIIELETEDGKKWEGIFLIESGEITLTIKFDDEELKFYDMANHTITEKTDNVYTTTDLSVKGVYENKIEDENHYHSAKINITDQGESIIEFEISAVNGMDIDHVNIGELSGIAEKVGTNKYVYEENIDGENYKITFTFDAHKVFQWVSVEESYYPNGTNPYAGHGVYFTGDYEMVN